MIKIFQLGQRIYDYGGVQVEYFKYPKIYFKIKNEYGVTYNIETFEFGRCECEHGSIWKGNKAEECKHIAACRCWLKEELFNYLDIVKKKFDSLNPVCVLQIDSSNNQKKEELRGDFVEG